MSEFRERQDEERWELMVREEFERSGSTLARVNAAADGEDVSAAAGTAD